jgi:DedD protein
VDEGLKRRLVGATVLVSLAVIFVPMLLEDGPVVSTTIDETNIPPRPDREFSSRVMPMESDDLNSLPDEADAAPEAIDRSGEGEQQQAEEVEERETTEEEENTNATDQKPEQAAGLREGISAWVVQVGSFSNMENAKKVESDLQQKGFPAFVEDTELNGKKLYRVLVGPEVDKKRAEKMVPKLEPALKEWKLSGKLRRYP